MIRFGEAFRLVREDRGVGTKYLAQKMTQAGYPITGGQIRHVERSFRMPFKPSQLREALRAMNRMEHYDELWSLAVLDRVLRVAPELEEKAGELKELIRR